MVLIGYQANFQSLDYGLFFFNHQANACGTTLVLNVAAFTDLYEGPKYSVRASGSFSLDNEGCAVRSPTAWKVAGSSFEALAQGS